LRLKQPGVFESIALVVREPTGNFAVENEWSILKGHHSKPGAHRISITKDKELAEIKDAQRFSDGSVESDLPMQQLSELFNVNHFIVSQVNPHSFLLASITQPTMSAAPIFDVATACLHFLKSICREWLVIFTEYSYLLALM
jgi:hypothetical protein